MESIGADLRQMQRTPLAASHVQALRDAGKTVTHPVGAILARSGEPITSFVYVEEGPMFLSRSARHVRVLVRGSSLTASMSSYLRSRLEADPKITIEYDSEVTALHAWG